MAQVAAASDPLKQLCADCRDQPVVFDNLRPVLCEQLAQIILARRQSDRGRKTGSLNVGGWKSSEDFFSWPYEAVQELCRSVVEMIGGVKPSVSWAMVNRAGSHHPRHQHRSAILMGVYYVTVGSADAVVPTIFECPCDGRPKSSELEVEPYPGRLVLCRGETWHSVPVYRGDLPRITVAFDVRR